METSASAWDGATGTGGGPAVGAALRALARERGFADDAAFARAAGFDPERAAALLDGRERATVPEFARIASALKLRAVEFLQKSGLLSLDVYAFGLDPLYFLPPGQVRHDARIYMREINPRHAVPERDMLVRNPALKAVMEDSVLDALGKLEVELAYLLRAAVQNTGGRL
jgi:hypothetical protein